MAFYVYIMSNRMHGTLYVGHTDDLVHRVETHKTGTVPGFSQQHDLKLLVYYELHDSREAARRRERRLKHWLRAWKIKLINEANPEWRDLAEDLNQ
ncbi:GIY-YIG nuclease family protein [Candidatus Phaeomarinobacter ectocarpi]|nr:GIY-YIG nuclease family protein [Candidatus Phaeomarinobacter ectocarpi]